MGLKIRRLRLRALTDMGMYGTDLKFTDGLNVLWADNTKGKSTSVQAIVYALGLEGMFGASREIPLPYAMTSYVEYGDDPASVASRSDVVHSYVLLEIENSKGRIVTVRRRVKTAKSTKLITVYDGPHISEPNVVFSSRDYYVIDPGSAVNEVGFYRFLADFIGWDIPIVSRYNGLECPLYIETLFPLFYVEQKSGWTELPAAFPTQFGIRELGRRAVEFAFGLHTHANELERQRLLQAINDFKIAWQASRQEIIGLSKARNARLSHFPSGPDSALEDLPDAVVSVVIDDQELRLEAAIDLLTQKATAARAKETPTSDQISSEAEQTLRRLTDELAELAVLRTSLFRDRSIEAAQLKSLEERLAAINDDLQKNKDVRKLRTLGSGTARLEHFDHCPTCDQPLEDSLLPQADVGNVMPLDDNIAYLNAQRLLFGQIKTQSDAAIDEYNQHISSISLRINEASSRIRAIRADLVAPGNAPSESVIEDRIRTEARLESLVELKNLIAEAISDLSSISTAYSEAKRSLSDIPKDNLSEDDRTKLSVFMDIVRQQLAQYSFTTFNPTELSLSDNYKLEKEGFEIRFQTSASDAIRLKWAYQLAMLELGRTRSTNHLGLLIFDEPRQQEAAKRSFNALLRRAAGAKQYKQQVIFATSEDIVELETSLRDLDVSLQVVDGWIIKLIEGE